MSEKVARGIEQARGLALGWLDGEHPDTPVKSVDDRTVADAVRAVAAATRDARLNLTPDQFAKITALVYEQASAAGAVDEDYVQRLLELMKR